MLGSLRFQSLTGLGQVNAEGEIEVGAKGYHGGYKVSTPTSPSLTFRKRVEGSGSVTPLRLFGGGRRGWMAVQKLDQTASRREREDGRVALVGEENASYV